MKLSNKSVVVSCLYATLVTGPAFAQPTPKSAETAPVAGSASKILGVTVDEVVIVAHGWSIKKQVLGKEVYSDKNEKLGKVEDVIVTPERSLSYVIIGVGGFLGVLKHDVAIPVAQLKLDKNRFLLPGVTKDILKAMPKFEYAK